MAAHRVTIDEARRIAVRAQLLGADRPTDLLDVVRRLTFLQLDPTAAIAPSADLFAWTRLGGSYEPAQLQRALEDDRTLFEHNATVRPMDDLPLYPAGMESWPTGGRYKEWLERNDRFRRDVLDLLERSGPLMSRDVPDTHVMPWPSSGWTNQRNVTQMLESLAMRGEVAIAGRRGRQRLWDLAERVYPADTPVVALAEARRIRDERRLRSLGIARATGPALPVEPVVVAEAGEPATVEGIPGTWRVDPEALAQPFEGAPRCCRPSTACPTTARTRWTSSASSTSSRCTSPRTSAAGATSRFRILHHDRLVGKLDATADRKAGVVRVHAVHPDVRFTRATTAAIDREIESLAAWLDLRVERAA